MATGWVVLSLSKGGSPFNGVAAVKMNITVVVKILRIMK